MYLYKLSENGLLLLRGLNRNFDPFYELITTCTEMMKLFTIPLRQVTVPSLQRTPLRRKLAKPIHRQPELVPFGVINHKMHKIICLGLVTVSLWTIANNSDL